MRSYGINHVNSSLYKPASNGAVGRVNRTFAEFLKNIVEELDWDVCLPRAVLTYNNTKHIELGMAPEEKLMTIPGKEQEKRIEGHPNWLPYAVGVKVKIKIVTVDRSLDKKLSEWYGSPFIITKVVSEGMAYEIE